MEPLVINDRFYLSDISPRVNRRYILRVGTELFHANVLRLGGVYIKTGVIGPGIYRDGRGQVIRGTLPRRLKMGAGVLIKGAGEIKEISG